MIEITYDSALAALKAAVSDRGENFVYEKPEGFLTCRYVHLGDGSEDVPGCGVGYALHHLGVPLEAMQPFEGCPASGLMDKLLGEELLTASDDARYLLSGFQSWQDSTTPWGESLERAVEETEYYKRSKVNFFA